MSRRMPNSKPRCFMNASELTDTGRSFRNDLESSRTWLILSRRIWKILANLLTRASRRVQMKGVGEGENTRLMCGKKVDWPVTCRYIQERSKLCSEILKSKDAPLLNVTEYIFELSDDIRDEIHKKTSWGKEESLTERWFDSKNLRWRTRISPCYRLKLCNRDARPVKCEYKLVPSVEYGISQGNEK